MILLVNNNVFVSRVKNDCRMAQSDNYGFVVLHYVFVLCLFLHHRQSFYCLTMQSYLLFIIQNKYFTYFLL